MMTWELAQNLDIEKYSAIISVGGDGTNNEVVNGMLSRLDKKRLPIGYLPNGSGNDGLWSFGVGSIEKALDFIVKGDIVKVDVTKVIMDHETLDEIPQDLM